MSRMPRHPHQRPDHYIDHLGDRATGVTRERLQKINSYERIGLSLNTPESGHDNFADVHLRWETQLTNRKGETVYNQPTFIGAWYSGPLESVAQIKVMRRSRLDVDEYARFRSVSPDLDIMSGGNAMVMENRNFLGLEVKKWFTEQAVHVWLFGPLSLENYPYGSLFLTLKGHFKPGRGFQKMEVRGSPFCEGIENFPRPHDGYATAAAMVEAYAHQVDATFPIPLPPKARGWEWKIEAYRRRLSMAQLADKRDGLPPEKRPPLTGSGWRFIPLRQRVRPPETRPPLTVTSQWGPLATPTAWAFLRRFHPT
jgi:hypothetical protein